MSKRKAKKLLAKWQKRLRLQDWDVRIRFVNDQDLDSECVAKCVRHKQKKAAHIVWRRKGNEPRDSWPKDNDEYVIVHELLHLHLWPVEPDTGNFEDPAWIAIETTIHAIARALVYGRKVKRPS